MRKNTKKKIAPVVVTALVVAYMGPIVAAVAYAAGLLGAEGGWGILLFMLLYAGIGGAVIVGILAAMTQRLREIDGGEEDEASKY